MPYVAQNEILAAFQQNLIGCWKNEPFGKDEKGNPVGGEDNPLSYNIMPLPEIGAPDGYILKNFRYHERLKFNDNKAESTLAIAAVAPNRGGLVSQNCRALFYEQQVRFAEGPQGPGGPQAQDKKRGDVVHVENGAWLWLPRFVQQMGPFPANPDKQAVTEDLEQPVDIMIAKQMSIPHGNSILALGTFDTIDAHSAKKKCERTATPIIKGSPVIPDGSTPYPMPAIAERPPASLKSNLDACARYSTQKSAMNDYQNPHPDLTRFPNRPLQTAVEIIKPDYYMHWYVTTLPQANGRGHVVNIPFERRVSDVIGYSAEYWLLFKGKDKHKHKYLAYTQTIPLRIPINEVKYVFPHITCNTVKYVSGLTDGNCPKA
jgi:hypothetical protein